MKLQAYRLRNYRRLRDVVIELDDKISIFVGANNSGKTSAVQGLYSLLRGDAKRLELFDFSASLWADIDKIGDAGADGDSTPDSLPVISLDLWFKVGEEDLAVVMPLLPSTEWDGKCVGLRVTFEPRNPIELVQRFRELREKGDAAASALKEKQGAAQSGISDYKPWPESLTKYLAKELSTEYMFRYYVLDEREFNGSYREISKDYSPLLLSGDKEKGGAALIKSLLKVDFLRAQRHLDDPDDGAGSRSENLSRKLSRFYQRHLKKREDDHQALQALDASEKSLNFHLQEVFKDTLERLKKLGYPGVNNPEIVIRAALEPSTVLEQDARVHYVILGMLSQEEFRRIFQIATTAWASRTSCTWLLNFSTCTKGGAAMKKSVPRCTLYSLKNRKRTYMRRFSRYLSGISSNCLRRIRSTIPSSVLNSW